MGYIVVERWDEFQHYKNRGVPWIKTYTRLLDDEAYLNLSGSQRAVLHGVWLAYSKTHRKVPENTAWLSRYLGLRVTKRTLQALNHAGYITFSSSIPLAPVYTPSSPDLEGEKEKEVSKGPSKGKPSSVKRLETLIENGGYELTDASLIDEMHAVGINGNDQARLLQLAADLRGDPDADIPT